ncbi:uncharacterized protein LOC111110667 [Crassostrea virginica]
MDYTTKSDILKTTSYSSDDVTDVWTIGFASLFGAGILMAAVLCLAVHVVSRCKASRQKQKSKNLYEKISGDLEFMEGGYCNLKDLDVPNKSKGSLREKSHLLYTK